MTMRQSVANLGEIMQLAFVPQDFDAAIAHWVKLGAGPFFVLRRNKPQWQTVYGRECLLELDVALGNFGDMQIEIIRQQSPEPSIYSDWYNARREGVHHTCMVVPDIALARRRCVEAGCTVVLEGRVDAIEWFYVDTGGGPGTYLEVIHYPPGTDVLSRMVREAHRGWDGSDPVRELGW